MRQLLKLYLYYTIDWLDDWGQWTTYTNEASSICTFIEYFKKFYNEDERKVIYDPRSYNLVHLHYNGIQMSTNLGRHHVSAQEHVTVAAVEDAQLLIGQTNKVSSF